MSDELKPCAHCGGEFEVERWSHVDWTEWRIICGRCGTSSDWYASPKAAMDAWNTRVDSENEEPSLKELTDDTQVLSDSRERLEADVRGAVHGAYAYEDYIPENMIFDWLDRQAAITEREAFMRGRALLDDEFAELTVERDELREELRIEREAVEACEGCDKVDSLQAELKAYEKVDEAKAMWAKAYEGEKAKTDSLTAERDELKEEIAKYKHDCGLLFDEKHKLTAERDRLADERYRYKLQCERWEAKIAKLEAELKIDTTVLEELRRQRDELTAECDRLQKVVQIQADSFQKIERELKEALDGQAS